MLHTRQRLAAGTFVVLGLATSLSACGSDDSGDSTATDDSSASGAPQGQGGPAAGDPERLAAIQECLEAAGLADQLPSGGMPTDMPTDLPTDMPEGEMPSGGPDGGGPGGGAFQDEDVQAALAACGIDLPSGPPSGAADQQE